MKNRYHNELKTNSEKLWLYKVKNKIGYFLKKV